MKVETPLMALVFLSLVFGGLFTFMVDLDSEYNEINVDLSDYTSEDGSQSFASAFNQINQTKAEIDKISEDFDEETISTGGGNDLFPFVSLTLKTVKKLFTSVSIFKDIISVASDILGLPPEIFITLTSVLIAIMIISILIMIIGRSNY